MAGRYDTAKLRSIGVPTDDPWVDLAALLDVFDDKLHTDEPTVTLPYGYARDLREAIRRCDDARKPSLAEVRAAFEKVFRPVEGDR